ncbi:hypothetical protein DUNSADRAFT_2282 [Dunaliella salina]|uniref:39S ribosomal protein L52, mitochondrial n=1 Tax=Dunaliella salina TaxID=3046 RepID=A0ABQ7GVT6_DUNSA|nr:hypothetical protein DUNSADRAFT_2282 [Dunaliella salina]|eukprot:KAF5838738.1 hypothetical protein DUNSADRAFT_2282 [Dunaliella salina]
MLMVGKRCAVRSAMFLESKSPVHYQLLMYENLENKETGRVWVRYENGHEAPLEPKLGAGFMTQLGYRRCPEADHIKRDVDEHALQRSQLEEQRKVVAEIQYCQENNLPIPEHLLPKPKKKGKKGKEGDKKK